MAHAFEEADVDRTYVVMLPGEFTAGAELSGKQVTLVGAGASFLVRQSSVTISVIDNAHLSVRGLEARGEASGAALTCASAELDVRDSTFRSIGISADECRRVAIQKSLFERTYVTFTAFDLVDAGLLVDSSIFLGPGPQAVGSVFFAQITNNLIVNDETAGPVALMVYNQIVGSPTVESRIAGNTIVGGYIQCNNPQTNGGTRRIFEGNIIVDQSSPVPKETACVYRFNLVNPFDSLLAGNGNLTGIDPEFVDKANGNYRLTLGSPAVDTANPIAIDDHDLDGTERPQGTVNDIGAYELLQP